MSSPPLSVTVRLGTTPMSLEVTYSIWSQHVNGLIYAVVNVSLRLVIGSVNKELWNIDQKAEVVDKGEYWSKMHPIL